MQRDMSDSSYFGSKLMHGQFWYIFSMTAYLAISVAASRKAENMAS